MWYYFLIKPGISQNFSVTLYMYCLWMPLQSTCQYAYIKVSKMKIYLYFKDYFTLAFAYNDQEILSLIST